MNTSFATELAELHLQQLSEAIAQASSADVERALRLATTKAPVLQDRDLVALISPAAIPYLETVAQCASRLTRRRFGRTMQLYAPIYLSNECVNRCTYCGFSQELAIRRATLDIHEVLAEGEALRTRGFRHLLLVSGEVPRLTNAAYVEKVVRALAPRFDSLSIETGTFDAADYARLARAGVDGLTLYQETYSPVVYRRVHLAGPKCRYATRIAALEDAGDAGFRTLGIGALLGLAPFRLEALLLALHGRYLSRRFWRSKIAISFPRIRATVGGFAAPHPVSDRDLVQMICTLRLALPDADLVLSTREPPALRDAMLTLGITRMSAGSQTNPGGYCQETSTEEESRTGKQFQVEDLRSAHEVAAQIAARGLDPVWKDFDRALVGGATFDAGAASPSR